MKITRNSIIKRLKSRLNSQRRIFDFDGKQVLVLPFLEHNDILNSINKIKFYSDSAGNYITINDIDEIKSFTDGSVHICRNGKYTTPIFHKKMNGSFEEIKVHDFLFENLTIDHSPSIYIVLYTMYLKKSNDFEFLTNYCKQIKNSKLDLQIIKEKGFKAIVEKVLDTSSQKDSIIKAYKALFDQINLEISLNENNNANLSLSSLEFYKKRSS